MCNRGVFTQFLLLEKLSFCSFPIHCNIIRISVAAIFTILAFIVVGPASFQRSQLRCDYISILCVNKNATHCHAREVYSVDIITVDADLLCTATRGQPHLSEAFL